MSSASFTCASWLKSVLGIQKKKKKKQKAARRAFIVKKRLFKCLFPLSQPLHSPPHREVGLG